jgi:prepilin-type N-terminal cleavage/methylation domain-containing protein
MRARDGFTILELVIVLMIGAMTMGVVSQQYGRTQGRRAVANARDAMILTASQARAEAMRSGQLVYLRVRPDLGVVRVATSSGEVLHTLRAAEFDARMVGSTVSMCYTSRGFALPGCTTFTGKTQLGFVRGIDTASVEILSLGQVRREQ